MIISPSTVLNADTETTTGPRDRVNRSVDEVLQYYRIDLLWRQISMANPAFFFFFLEELDLVVV